MAQFADRCANKFGRIIFEKFAGGSGAVEEYTFERQDVHKATGVLQNDLVPLSF
jgi:hypothetical protein